MSNVNRKRTDVLAELESDAQNAHVDRQLTIATIACRALQARGLSVWAVFIGNVRPTIRLRWTPACDELMRNQEVSWYRVRNVKGGRTYTFAWPFMDCRVEWELQGDLH